MAKLPNGILGPVIGKVGTVSGYILNGKYIVRGLPKPRTNKKTKKEKSNTRKFAKVQAWMSPLSEFVKVGFKDYGTETGGYKAAVSYTLKNAVEGVYPHQVVNPALVRVSGGELFFPAVANAVLENNLQLRFTWDPAVGENGSAYDQAMVLAYCPEHKTLKGNPTGAFRMQGTDVLKLIARKEDAVYHIYLGFVARDRSFQSHSMYLGHVLVPKKIGVKKYQVVKEA